MPAITNDAALTNDYPEELNDDSFVNALMANEPEEGDDAGEDQPSKKKREPKPTEQANDDDEANDDEPTEETPEGEDESDEDGEDGKDDEGQDEDDKPAKKFTEDDGVYTKVKVGEEEHEVSIKDLKRLYGQEAALTRKSQEVATERTAVETKRAENIAAYDVLLKRATERANKYRELPWVQLQKDPNVPADQLQALMTEAQGAVEEETFLKAELGNFMQKVQTEQATARRTAAQECLKQIKNPESPAHIKGWTDALYNDLRTFGTEMGIPETSVNEITDAGAIKILHMAMQFHRGQSKVVVTKPVDKTPKKIVKNSASSPASRGTPAQVTAKSAVAKARKSGSMQDAANAFEALLGDD
jgi:hypothetical protein